MDFSVKKFLSILAISMIFAFLFIFIQNRNSAKQNTVSTEVTTEKEDKQIQVTTYTSLSSGKEEFFTYETEFFEVRFCTTGASVSSLKMKNYTEKDGNPVDLIFRENGDKTAFLLYWQDDLTKPVLDNFDYQVSGNKVIFTNDYQTEEGKTFTLVKTFEFRPSDYLIKVSVDIRGDKTAFNGKYGYTLAFEPQVGPSFVSLANNRYEYRNSYVGLYQKNKIKRRPVTLTNNKFENEKIDAKWISLTGKYFSVVAYPADEVPSYKYSIIRGTANISQTDSLYISVPNDSIKDSKDFYFYCGPQLKSYMGNYYSGTDNEWGLRNLNLDDAMESGSVLGWLANILKWCISMIYKVIPNYGVAIIILTLLIKLATWPLQTKSMVSSQRMSALSPKIEEIKKKYPNNPQKQNAETQKVYQENGISPLSGCTSLFLTFLQFPILIAFYSLLSRHFELRGAMFIPGWIEDLSLPETIATLPFKLPVLGNQIHLLPFLYLATTVLSMMYTQKSNPMPNKKNNLLLTWGMPLFFLFLLYSAPSGVFVFWVTQSIFGILPQVVMNIKKKKQIQF